MWTYDERVLSLPSGGSEQRGYIGSPCGYFGRGLTHRRFNGGLAHGGNFNRIGMGSGFRTSKQTLFSNQQYEEDGSQYAYDFTGNIIGYSCNFGTLGSKSNFGEKSQTTGPVHSPIQLPIGGGQGALKISSLCPPQKGLFGAGPTEQGHTKDMWFESACNLNITDPLVFSSQNHQDFFPSDDHS